jgi:Short C-terminal domain
MPGLLRGVARTAVVAGTATAVSNRVSRRQANRWAAKDQQAYEDQAYEQQQQQQAYQQPSQAYQAPPAPDMDAKLEQLRQLGDLKSQGVLSEAEFEAQKQRILSS